MTARLLPLLLVILLGPPANAQRHGTDIDAQVVGLFRFASRTPAGRGLSEVRAVQPVVMLRTPLGRGFGLRATANLEGLTIPDGELLPGSWGEGFVDRRHPHTYVHELLVEGVARPRCGPSLCRLGAFAGKGFVPFGSDDPMSRGFLAYPVNHHLAQILERAVVGVQLGIGVVALEGALFNGDEPESPGQWPRLARFGDSWSARVTVEPVPGVAASGSVASVASPEHRPGAGATQSKYHLALRAERPFGSSRLELLAEWARTSELDGFFVFDSRLAEVQWAAGAVAIRYRIEITDRPEEERVSAFRSARPHLENSLLGESRWTTHIVGAAVPLWGRPGGRSAAAMLEVGTAAIRDSRGGLFDAAETYGGTRLWTVSLGLRLAVGFADHRMGRYGIVAAPH